MPCAEMRGSRTKVRKQFANWFSTHGWVSHPGDGDADGKNKNTERGSGEKAAGTDGRITGDTVRKRELALPDCKQWCKSV